MERRTAAAVSPDLYQRANFSRLDSADLPLSQKHEFFGRRNSVSFILKTQDIRFDTFWRLISGCERDYEAMIGFEKMGNRNNLRAIRSVECCQLTNSTGNVYRTSIKTIFRTGSTECHDGYFVQGKNRALRLAAALRPWEVQTSTTSHATLLSQSESAAIHFSHSN